MEGLRPRRHSEKHHSHGCSQSPHPFQVSSWVVSLLFVVCFYLMVIPVLPLPVGISLGLIYCGNTCLSVMFGLLATITDPTDAVVLAERRAKRLNQKFDSSQYSQICTICKAHVHDYSKHCGQCDRCVDGFDHHCKWLNNCVGQRNYRYFAALLGCADTQLCFQTVVTGYVVHGLLAGDLRDSLETVYGLGGDTVDLYAGVLAAMMLVLTVCFCALLQLILLHIWLRKRGLTTYEYIIMQRQRKKAASHRRVQPSLAPLQASPPPESDSSGSSQVQHRKRGHPPSSSSAETKDLDNTFLNDDKSRNLTDIREEDRDSV